MYDSDKNAKLLLKLVLYGGVLLIICFILFISILFIKFKNNQQQNKYQSKNINEQERKYQLENCKPKHIEYLENYVAIESDVCNTITLVPFDSNKKKIIIKYNN